MPRGVASSPEPPSAAAADPGALDPQAAREFALIADAAPVPMWTTRPDGTRGFVNRCYLEFLGVDRAAGLAFDWRTILHPDDAERVRAETVAAVAAGGVITTEARYRRHDGEWRWVRAVSSPRSDAEGAAGGYVGVGHDVTEAKVAELALRARERQLSVLIDQTAAGLAQIDLDGRFTLVNDRFCEIVGRPRAELMRRTARSITHPDDRPRNDAQMAAMLADGQPITADKRYVRPDGSTVWVSNSVALSRDEAGAPSRVIAISLDITARREAEAAVRASEARLEFLDALGTATVAATDADAMLAVTTRMLGEQLGAAACGYADVDPDGDRFHTRGAWHVAPVPALVGSYRIGDFGAAAAALLAAGQPWIVDDHKADPADTGAFRGTGIRATACMPFLRGGRLAGIIAVHDAAPRHWTEGELALLREVAARSWAHVERVRAETALRESESQLRLAVEGARIGTWHWDPVTRRGGWSPRTAEIMGVPYDQPLSQREQAAMIHPDDRARVLAGSAALATAGTDFTTEYRIVRPDGEVRWIASHGLIMRNEAGEAIRAIGTIRDVTTRRRAQEELTALNQNLEAEVAERTAERDRMWRLSRDLLVIVDRRRRVSAVNPAVAGLGYDAADVVGRPLAAFIHPDDRLAALSAVRRVAHQPIGQFAARLIARDGSWRNFVWSAAPGDGEAYVIGRDVTADAERRVELEQAQEALRQAQKMESLGQLTGGVAHDFNNLLTPIIGNLDLLGRRAGDDERVRRLVRGALESAERARVLVQRLLAFARRQPLRPGPVDIRNLLAGIEPLIASTVGAQVTVTVRAAEAMPAAMADANQLELALLNLAVNARDAMPDGGALSVTAFPVADPPDLPRGRYVALSVFDTGVGMDAATLVRAPEPFFSTKGVGKGTGLGLSMVHGLASQLGGAMRLDSRPGHGTRVALLLPAADAPAAAPRPSVASEPAAAGSGRVLLVDDETPVREATAAMLAGLGYEVATAASGEAALTLLDGADFLVTDHLMPGMKGAELAQLARARRPGLKLLVISGYAALDEVPADLPRLAKPFRLDELARALGTLA